MNDPVTIITSVYSSSDDFLLKVVRAVKQQEYKGKVRHIIINDNPKRKITIPGVEIINHQKSTGLTALLNEGFKMAKTEFIVSLMDDCLPSSNKWLATLVKPLQQDEVGATTSDVELPREFWEKFDYFARALTVKEQRVITPGLDEKGCAYKKSILEKYGYLNEQEFHNGGEDTDLTVKMEKDYQIVHTLAKVYHYHHFTFESRLRKEAQYAKLSGLVSRKHFFKLPWNFKLQVAARLFTSLFFLVSLFFHATLLLALILLLLISNQHLPKQVQRLWYDPRVIFIPFINLYVHWLYVICFVYALVLKPTV